MAWLDHYEVYRERFCFMYAFLKICIQEGDFWALIISTCGKISFTYLLHPFYLLLGVNDRSLCSILSFIFLLLFLICVYICVQIYAHNTMDVRSIRYSQSNREFQQIKVGAWNQAQKITTVVSALHLWTTSVISLHSINNLRVDMKI